MKKSKSVKLREISEGDLDTRESENYDLVPSPTFVKMIVLDVISDPINDINDRERVKKWESYDLINKGIKPGNLPRNTIVAKETGNNSRSMYVLPFFPSHLSLPCKPGEAVWVMFDRPEQGVTEVAFWFGRVVDGNISDDVNHTHPGNVFAGKSEYNAKELRDKSISEEKGEELDLLWSEMRNGPTLVAGEDRMTIGESVILPGQPEDIFERLITDTVAASRMSYESVPRFKKRPGDIVLEGTNNSLLVLGTDRKGDISKTRFHKDSGTIDMVTGRGKTAETLGKEIQTTRIKGAKGKQKGEELKKEVDKNLVSVSTKEGDPDYKNDRSRVLISQRTSPDDYFELSSGNKKLGLEDSSQGDAAIVVKSDKIRLIARSDIQLIVKGYDSGKDSKGYDRKDEKSSDDDWASITIKSSGEIIIKPAKTAVIKLGGEEADKAILCSSSKSLSQGEVTGVPLTDTMGGNIGVPGSPVTGVFSKKVLIT